MLDLTPATETLTKIVTDIDDDQLGGPTPCRGTTVADLLDHLDGLSVAFTAAAGKDSMGGSQAPSADGSRLGPDWRMRISDRLAHLAKAWQDETARDGMTRAGGRGPARRGGRTRGDQRGRGARLGHRRRDRARLRLPDPTDRGGIRVRGVRRRTEPGREPGAVRPASKRAGLRAAARSAHRVDWPRSGLAASSVILRLPDLTPRAVTPLSRTRRPCPSIPR